MEKFKYWKVLFIWTNVEAILAAFENVFVPEGAFLRSKRSCEWTLMIDCDMQKQLKTHYNLSIIKVIMHRNKWFGQKMNLLFL